MMIVHGHGLQRLNLVILVEMFANFRLDQLCPRLFYPFHAALQILRERLQVLFGLGVRQVVGRVMLGGSIWIVVLKLHVYVLIFFILLLGGANLF
jgi:hypothetical protein